MEWKRNKQDAWHLARSSTRGADGVHEKKKYNKDEDNYFEGTSSQKGRKNRKQSEGASQPSPRTVPPGFNLISGPSGPPPVNAWAQKKGSALFSRPDEVDEEDEMLKLVLEESLKTAEEDQKRALERMKMSNREVEDMTPAERGWEDTTDQSEPASVAFTKAVGIPQPQPSDRAKTIKREMQLPVNSNIPSEKEEEVRQPSEKELHFIDTDVEEPDPKDHRRSLRPRTKKTSTSDTQDRRAGTPTHNQDSQKSKVTCESPGSHGASPTPKYSEVQETRPVGIYSPPANTGVATPDLTYRNPMPSYEINQNTILPEKDHNLSSVRELTTGVSASLTFGDTQGLLEKIQSDYTYQTPSVADNYLLDTSAYQLRAGSENTKSSLSSSFSDSIDETDIMLHNFLRHDPPSGTNAHYQLPDAADIAKAGVNGFLNPNPYTLHNDDSSSSVSDSSVQNASPYGSYDKPMNYGLSGIQPQNSQYSYVFPTAQNLHMQSNLVSPLSYSVPPGYAAPRGIIPHNPQMPGMAQYCLPNSNMMMPPTLDPQAHLLSMINYQTIIAGMQKDQNCVIPQPQPQMMPMQPSVMSTQVQPMNIPTDPDKQDINASEAQPARKSKEEIMMDYQRTLQTLNKLQLELASQGQTSPLPVYTGYPAPTGHPVMGLYGGVPAMPQHSPSQLSPLPQQQRFTMAPNPDTIFDPNTHVTAEPPVGRGRGRLV